MSVNLLFLAGPGLPINDLSGSGLGFYGAAGFGQSVNVGAWNGRTFITDANGLVNGAEVNNVQFLNAGSGILGQAGTGIGLKAIPNFQSTLRISLQSDVAVQALNPKLRIYDRSNPDNNPSGVVCKVAQLIHPDITQTSNGSGDGTWQTPAGSSSVMSLAPCPGVSGLYAGNGSNSTRPDTQHDWYTAISAQPTSIGRKTQFGLWASVDYL